MTNLEERRGQTRRRVLTVFAVGFGLLNLIALVLSVALYRQTSAIAALREAQADVRAQLEATGYPTTWEAWEASQPPLDGEDNGAPHILEAVALYRGHTGEQDRLLPYVGGLEVPTAHERYPEESLALMGALAEANRPSLEALTRGLEKPYIRFSPPDGNADGESEEVQEEREDHLRLGIRAVTKTLKVAVDYAIDTGDDESLWPLLRAQAGSYKLYIDLESAFRYGRVQKMCDTIERLLNNHTVTAGRIGELQDLLEPADFITWHRTSLLVEADEGYMLEPRLYLLLDPVWTFAAQSPLPDSALVRIEGSNYEAYKLRKLENILDAYQQCTSIWKDVAPVIAERRRVAESEGNKLSDMDEMGPYQRMDYLFRGRARLQVTRIALAVEAYRDRHGQLPDTLVALREANPSLDITDPFDGEPIRYVKKGMGYVLYSVDINMADDGGATYRKRDEQLEMGDMVFEVRR